MGMLYPASELEWLKIRHGMVSSTESAALFGLSPYSTAFELAVSKKEPLQEFEPNPRMTWGLRLERAVAKGLAEDYGITVRKINGYAIHEQCKAGASFDFEICGLTDMALQGGVSQGEARLGGAWQGVDSVLRDMYSDLGTGILEIKCVDRLIFNREWKEEDGQLTAPAHIEIQLQSQLECINRKWGVMGVLIGGNDTQLVIRERDHEVGKAIVSKVNDFWKLLDSGGMPPVKLPEDVEIIRRLYMGSTPGKLLDAREDEEMKALCAKYREQADLQKMYEELRKSTGAKILMRIGDAEKVMVDGYSISAGTVGEVTIESYVRKPYRNMTIREKKN